MEKGRLYIRNAVILALVNILLRGAAVSFNGYVSGKIGAESMGLFTLVMSIYGFAVTLATSSVHLAAVRLTAERCARLAGADAVSYRIGRCGSARPLHRAAHLFGAHLHHQRWPLRTR